MTKKLPNTIAHGARLVSGSLDTRREYSASIVIAAYNASRTISRAIRSALLQSMSVDVIVVDDASADNTVDLAASLDDGSGRLKVVAVDRNSGPAVARNIGLDLSLSQFVTPLDADDYMLPGRMEKLIAKIADADFLADDLFYKLEDDDRVSPSEMVDIGRLNSKEIDLAYFVEKNIPQDNNRRELGFLKPLIRRDFLNRHCLRYDEGLRFAEDYALYASGLAAGASFVLTHGLGYVAVHRANSLSTQFTRSDLQKLLDFDARLLNEAALSVQERRIIRWHSVVFSLIGNHRFAGEPPLLGVSQDEVPH